VDYGVHLPLIALNGQHWSLRGLLESIRRSPNAWASGLSRPTTTYSFPACGVRQETPGTSAAYPMQKMA
jgi:hypothetical protein